MTSLTIPRIVIGAVGSGVGKTTVAIGLMKALRARGLSVAPFKCGPDYLDPTYHQRAAKRFSHNLDGWMMGRSGVLETFAQASAGADIAIVEGMMGLFDSSTPITDEGSTAEIAKWLEAPVLLVVDAGGMARTIGAVATGFGQFDPALRLAGLIGNNVGGRGHLELLRQASPAIPMAGGLPRRPAATLPERHLGLFGATTDNVPDACFEEWGRLAAEWLDLDAIIGWARSAPPVEFKDERATVWRPPRCRIGVAYDEAFHFYYEYNLTRLTDLGAELVRFSPMHDHHLPPIDGLYIGGGYPETVASNLSANRSMLQSIRNFASAGGLIYAECGGLMYLAEGIRTLDGATTPMCGLIPGNAVMHETLAAIGYADIATVRPSFLGPSGTGWRGHQFRYSSLEPAPLETIDRVYRVTPRWGGEPFAEGYRCDNVIASYVHGHWASNPAVPANFVAACTAWRETRRPA